MCERATITPSFTSPDTTESPRRTPIAIWYDRSPDHRSLVAFGMLAREVPQRTDMARMAEWRIGDNRYRILINRYQR